MPSPSIMTVNNIYYSVILETRRCSPQMSRQLISLIEFLFRLLISRHQYFLLHIITLIKIWNLWFLLMLFRHKCQLMSTAPSLWRVSLISFSFSRVRAPKFSWIFYSTKWFIGWWWYYNLCDFENLPGIFLPLYCKLRSGLHLRNRLTNIYD